MRARDEERRETEMESKQGRKEEGESYFLWEDVALGQVRED